MLTICLPVYNYNICKLAVELSGQALESKTEIELLVIDDGSDQQYNDQWPSGSEIRIIRLEKNVGRARVRNLFYQYARFENLLFLDCDSDIISDGFLKKYLSCIHQGDPVVCGGRVYSHANPGRNKMLHWKYGMKKESKPAEIRNIYPERSFMTNNFLIRKNIFKKIVFNETLEGYGHEDTLFGFQLHKAGIPIRHIDNPVMHGSLATNQEFLQKTRSAIKNLIIILQLVNNDPEFVQGVPLLRTFFSLKKSGFYKPFYFFSKPFISITSFLLRNGFVNIWLFDLFKISLFVSLYTNDKR
jgi:glycosyltransferase involved in cell wall biosynthesis